MHKKSKFFAPAGLFRSFVASLLGILLIATMAMAACPALHQHHHDSAAPHSDDCAVCQLSNGLATPVICPLDLAPDSSHFISLVFVEQFSFSQFQLALLPPGRAPPPISPAS